MSVNILIVESFWFISNIKKYLILTTFDSVLTAFIQNWFLELPYHNSDHLAYS
jgi:hypothetical protein